MSKFKPGDLIVRYDRRRFPSGRFVERVIERPKDADTSGPFEDSMVWMSGGTWIDRTWVDFAPAGWSYREEAAEDPAPPWWPPTVTTVPKLPEPDWKARYERELKGRRREEKRNAKINTENAALRKRVQDLDWEARRNKIMYEQSRMKEFGILKDRLALIKDIATTPIDDWVALAGEPTTEMAKRKK